MLLEGLPALLRKVVMETKTQKIVPLAPELASSVAALLGLSSPTGLSVVLDAVEGDAVARLLGEQADRISDLQRQVAKLQDLLARRETHEIQAPARQDDRFYFDPLTGLFSHTYFFQILGKEAAKSKRYGNPVSCLFVDIDHLDMVNARFSYEAGDQVIQAVARSVRDSVRTCDTVAQLGGEEFALVLPETDREGALITAERIRGEISRLRIAGLEDQFLTVSIGLASVGHGEREGDLVGMCKHALQAAKAMGGNICVPWMEPPADGEDLPRRNPAAIDALLSAVAAKDGYTFNHSHNVGYYADRLAAQLNLPAGQREIIRQAGILHDLGKIGIPDAILNKEGSLTAEEYEVVKRHPGLGHDIASRTQQLEALLPAILYHHERWDGRGYPAGLAREGIPLEARIICVADAYDAMTTDRPYRRRLPKDTAIAELQRCAGQQFDCQVVEAMLAVLASDQRA